MILVLFMVIVLVFGVIRLRMYFSRIDLLVFDLLIIIIDDFLGIYRLMLCNMWLVLKDL